MFWRKKPQPTTAQLEAIEILKDEFWLNRKQFVEIIVDRGMSCRVDEDRQLAAVAIDHNFIFEIQEDDSILFIVEDIFDRGWKSYHPLHLIQINGEIEDL
jgi:hypothetical protein